MSIIVSNCQHCNEQHFQTLCTLHDFLSVVKLDLYMRALLLDRILAPEKNTRAPRVHLVHEYNSLYNSVPTIDSDMTKVCDALHGNLLTCDESLIPSVAGP